MLLRTAAAAEPQRLEHSQTPLKGVAGMAALVFFLLFVQAQSSAKGSPVVAAEVVPVVLVVLLLPEVAVVAVEDAEVLAASVVLRQR